MVVVIEAAVAAISTFLATLLSGSLCVWPTRWCTCPQRPQWISRLMSRGWPQKRPPPVTLFGTRQLFRGITGSSRPMLPRPPFSGLFPNHTLSQKFPKNSFCIRMFLVVKNTYVFWVLASKIILRFLIAFDT